MSSQAPGAVGRKGRARSGALHYTPKRALVFDTETTTDHTQALRVGAYQLQGDGELRRGIFYDPDRLAADELAVIQAYARRHSLRLLTAREFVNYIIYCE